MRDGVELASRCFVVEYDRCHAFSIELTALVEHLGAELANDLGQTRRTRRDDLASELIGIDHGQSALTKSRRDRALARANPARQTENTNRHGAEEPTTEGGSPVAAAWRRRSNAAVPLDFKRRLAGLGPGPAAERRLENDAGAGEDDVLLRLREPVGESSRSTTLEELRRRMQAILGKPVAPPRPAADPSRTELPFVREDTDHGPIYRRHERLLPSHHVGRMPADAAYAARADILALLALDPSLSRSEPRRAVYLDTETTGLGGGAGILAFLVGLAWFDGDGRLVLEQLLLRTPADEPALLHVLAERLADAGLIVTYNGKTFDLPLLATRFVMNRLAPPPSRPHLDLLHVGRRLHRARLGACRLVSLESDVLGFVRGPDIEGGEVSARYGHFLRTGDEEALRAVVEHNAWDVVSMAALVGLYGEPLSTLHDHDLVGLARTLRRAGDLERADEAAHAAVERGAGNAALRVRGEIAKARGDRVRALADFEALSSEVDDASVRLELAKLYEHHVKQPLRALELVAQGTGEDAEALERRRARLGRKLERARERAARKKSD
jgi:uncharacterized protein